MNQSLLTMIRREEELMQETEKEKEALTATMQPKVILSEFPNKIASF
jgi:hypothetical protein